MEASAQQISETVELIPVNLIDVSGKNPRKVIKGESFEEFKASVKRGLIEPILVRPSTDDRYELVVGERRLTAVKELKTDKILARVKVLSDQEALETMLIENLQREDLAPLEEAAALDELLKTGLTQQDLAKRVSKSQPWIANRIRLLKAPKQLKDLVAEGKISPQHVIELLPYVEYKVFSEELLPQLKQQLKYGPVTVERLKDSIAQGLGDGKTTLSLTSLTWGTGHLRPHFDLTGCDSCKDAIETGSRRNQEKDRICLNRSCWGDRLNRAKHEHDKVKKQDEQDLKKELEKKLGKKVKSLSVDTSKLDYNSYVTFYYKEFDLADCKNGCEFYKLEKGRNATLEGDKDPRHVCLKPSCYRGKKAQASRVRNKAVREELSFVDKSLEEYLNGRASGFSLEELRYVCERIADIAPHTYGRGKDLDDAIAIVKKGSARELECSILRVLAKEQLGPIRSSLSKEELRKVEKGLPFEIARDKPEPPKEKKVQEKRKRKGVTA